MSEPNGLCFCGCGAPTREGAFFKTGHDKKVEGDLNAIHHKDSVVERLLSLGYGPAGLNLHERAIELGVRERCGVEGCNVSGVPGGVGLRRHRQRAHPTKRFGAKALWDPAFETAIERKYLAEMNRVGKASLDDQVRERRLSVVHSEILETAVFHADRGSGGLRFKSLDGRNRLEERLLGALRRFVEQG